MKKFQKLNRAEMKSIMGGLNEPCLNTCSNPGGWCGNPGICDPTTGDGCDGLCELVKCASTGLNYSSCVLF